MVLSLVKPGLYSCLDALKKQRLLVIVARAPGNVSLPLEFWCGVSLAAPVEDVEKPDASRCRLYRSRRCSVGLFPLEPPCKSIRRSFFEDTLPPFPPYPQA